MEIHKYKKCAAIQLNLLLIFHLHESPENLQLYVNIQVFVKWLLLTFNIYEFYRYVSEPYF